MEVQLDPSISLFQQKVDDKVQDNAGRQWFKPNMEGEPDFIWVNDGNGITEGPGQVLPFGPLLI